MVQLVSLGTEYYQSMGVHVAATPAMMQPCDTLYIDRTRALSDHTGHGWIYSRASTCSYIVDLGSWYADMFMMITNIFEYYNVVHVQLY